MLTIDNLRIDVEFSFKVNQSDANATSVKTTLDFSKHSADDLMTRACADAVIDLQRRLRSGKVSVSDKAEVKDASGKVITPAVAGINGKTYEVSVPGSRGARTSPEDKLLALAKKLGITNEQLLELAASRG